MTKDPRLLEPAPVGTGNSDIRPISPRKVSDTGLDEQLLVELLSKVLYLRGSMALVDIAQHVRLPASVVEELFGFMRAERLVELLRRGDSAADADYGLTESGRARAGDYLRKNRYAGPAPVSMAAYARQVRSQSVGEMTVTEADVEQVYRGMVVAKELRDTMGAAMNSGRPMFFYGPAGSGKTFLAETLIGLLKGIVYVPHAFVADGEIVQVFDPAIHRAAPAHEADEGLDSRARTDARWMACYRPVAVSGGELTLEMLNLQYDHVAGFYQAPAHVKANNGLFIIDDLGRQLVQPEQLMNRWIVPMDRRRDYLCLHTGSSFEIPFDVKLVFSTNLDPRKLADEAFLRRLGYKMHIGPITDEQYEQLFKDVCVEYGIAFDAAAFSFLINLHRHLGRPTFACYPRDLVSHVRDYVTYRDLPHRLTPQLIEWAWHSYFATN